MRKLTKAITVVSLLAPVSGYSLGIGDIRVRSSLNQNLNAEISLVAGRGENPSNIKVSLAPAERFDAAGIPWTYFLSKLRFHPVVKANGSMVIKVTSKEAVKEPYLNFLLEVSWPKGNLYREFTVLVDPPADYHHESYQQPAYQEPVYPSESNYEMMPPIERQAYVPRRRPARAARVRHYVPHVPRAPKPKRVIAAGNYGGQIVTRRNDTLWNVAARARGAGVTVEQMMMALYNQNPQAFYQQNVNALSARRALKIPDKGTVEQMSHQEALAEFARHNQAWNTNRAGIPRTESQVAQESPGSNQLELEPPAEASVGANETVTPSTEQAPSNNQQAPTPAPQAVPAQEGVKGGTAPVDKALQDKIAALEKQMANMQQVIELKNKQLADLQNPANKPTTPIEPPKPPIPVAPITPPPPQAEVKPVPTKPLPVPPPVTQATKNAVPPTPVQPSTAVKPPRTVVKPQPTPVVETESFLPWVLGATGATVLSIFGWLWWRKQKLLKETDAESMFRNYTMMRNSENSSSLSTQMRRSGASTIGKMSGSGESSFLNDFKASDFESFESFNVDHSDIDPVAEADVYLAYGRYQQAEDLIKDAIKEHPNRDDCKLKLLEIYQASSNKAEFEAYAKHLAAAGKKDDANFWAKVILLARDISSDTELFSHSAQANVAVFATDDSETGTGNVLFDIATPSAAPSEGVTTADAATQIKPIPDTEHLGAATFVVDESEGQGSSFELSESDMPEVSQGHGDEDVVSQAHKEEDDLSVLDAQLSEPLDDVNIKDFQDNESLDFNLGPYPGAKDAEAAPKPNLVKPDDSAQIESYDFDFNFEQDQKGKPATAQSSQADAAWDASNSVEFSFDDDLADGGLGNNEALDFNFELETPAVEASKPLGKDFSVSDLTDMDEMETKLDLAKAYVDMGDADSAKDIIRQVIEHGSAEQKKTAQLLLDDLNLG